MILRIVDRFFSAVDRRGPALFGVGRNAEACRQFRAAALVLGLLGVHFASSQAAAEELPCNRIAKVLGSGTVADRNRLAAEFPDAATLVVAHCRVSLQRGFANEMRPHLSPPTMQAWRTENQWLAEFLKTLPPERAHAWVRRLDPRAIEPDRLAELIVHWAAPTTAAAETVFALLGHLESSADRTRALIAVEPLLLQLEGESVTSATAVRAKVRELGYTALFADGELTALWSLRLDPISPAALDAFAALGSGEEKRAFEFFGLAAREEPPYLVHAGALAERLFRKGALEPAALLPLRIDFARCDDGYRVLWQLGRMAKLSEASLPPEFAAELALRRAFKCGDLLEEDTDADYLTTQYGRWRRKFYGTRAESRYRIAYLEKMADYADTLTNQGRRVQGNELREFVYRETLDERPYRFLGGVTQARALRARVRGWLAFPPDPEVYLNDPMH